MDKKYSFITENEISYKIRGAIFNVYNNLGPGLLETVYVLALCYELKLYGLDVKTEVPVPVYYGDVELEAGFRLDILVANKVIIEVKSFALNAEVSPKMSFSVSFKLFSAVRASTLRSVCDFCLKFWL